MKYGFRTPSVKKSVKARTTGRVKRTVKKSVNPLYGKKGTGIVNNPKKTVYNKVYNKTTIGVSDIYNSNTSKSNRSTNQYSNINNENASNKKRKKVQVPIGEHATTKSERISQTIISVILFLLATIIDLWIFAYYSTAFKIITISILFIIMIFLIVDAWKRQITIEYKKVYEDELTSEDIELIKQKKPNCKNTNDNDNKNDVVDSTVSELPWDFYTQNQKFLDSRENKLVNYAVESKKKMDPEIKIKHFEEMIEFYYDFKNECYNKSPQFKLYFEQSWEHCSNSKNPDFEYIKPYEEKLDRLKKRQK